MASNTWNNLDDPGLYVRLDPSGLRKRLRDLPRHCLAAWRQARAFSLPEDWASSDKVVMGGMGGSAIAGVLAADLAATQGGVPILVVRDLLLPFAVGEHTLFVACSYSGNTKETISLFEQAVRTRARVVAISGGGTLAEEAGKHGVPLLAVDIAAEPRSAVGYNLLLILGLLGRMGLLRIGEEEVRGAVDSLSRRLSHLTEDVPAADNPAKRLAMGLTDKLILVYGSGLFSGMADRWKTQFNENAKVWAVSEKIPELLHNSVEAFGASFPPADRMMVLQLRPGLDEGRHGPHHEAVSELLKQNGIPHRTLRGQDEPPLGQLLETLLLGDYVSYYLALLQGVDPSPAPSIAAAKALLANPPERGQG